MSNEPKRRPLIRKYIIKGKIKVITGLSIGGTMGISIGGIDLVVIRDPLTNRPYIPGSSLKGKMRALLERLLEKPLMNMNTGGAQPIYRHECGKSNCEVCRLFGSSKKDDEESGEENIPSRLIVRDSFLTEGSVKELEELEGGLPYTEWKVENAIDRITSAASPRQVERVPAGAVFSFEIVYTVENKDQEKEDLKNILAALKLLEDDYLGWGGSRGSGKVKFHIDEVIVRDKEYYLGDPSKERKEKVDKDLEDIMKNRENLEDFLKTLMDSSS